LFLSKLFSALSIAIGTTYTNLQGNYMHNNELYEQLSEDFNNSLFSADWDYTEASHAKYLFNELLLLEASLLNKWDADKETIET